jgi:hypothetical protein
MRITADMNSVIPGGINVNQSVRVLNRNAKRRSAPVPTSQNIQNSLVSRLQRERTLGDALSIAQMSHSVIQKAMNVTSRLRSLASQAFSGSSVNADDLNQVLSQIDNLIGEYGESVSIPAVTGGEGAGSRMEAVIENLKSTRETAGSMDRGNNYNLEVINSQFRRLSGMEGGAAREIEGIKESMNKIVSEYPSFKRNDIAAMSKRTLGVITESPAEGMKSHNTLHPVRTRINIYG